MSYPFVAQRIFNVPLLIHPQKLDAIIAGLGPRLLGAPLTDRTGLVGADHAPLEPALFSTRRGERADRGYRVVDGVAVLNVSGALVHRSRFLMADSSFLQGYNDLAVDLEDAMGNPDVHAVLQVYDTPGGEVQGAFEYAQRVLDMRGKKPMRAIADGMAASAGYLGASAADELAITTTGYGGSVGVVMRHVDFSRALANDGITVTHVFAGAHKVDGNPFEPLPAAVRAELQGEIDAIYTEFVDAVARHRRVDAAAVRKTEAATYRGVSAIAAGLADRIATTDQLIAELAALRARSYPAGPASAHSSKENPAMTGTTTQPSATTPAAGPAATAATGATTPAADIDRARADGAAGERARTAAILALPAAASNMAQAVQCVSAGLTVEQATAILGAAPQPIEGVLVTGAPAASKPGATVNSDFAAAMAATGNPKVSGQEAGAGAGNDAEALAAQVLASFRGTAVTA